MLIKKTTCFLLLTATTLFASAVYADAAASADKLAAEEIKLKAVMQELKSCYAKDPAMQLQLKKVESSWNSYKRAMIDANFPRPKDESIYTSYGSQGAAELADFNLAMTQQHINFLNAFSKHESPAQACKDNLNL